MCSCSGNNCPTYDDNVPFKIMLLPEDTKKGITQRRPLNVSGTVLCKHNLAGPTKMSDAPAHFIKDALLTAADLQAWYI